MSNASMNISDDGRIDIHTHLLPGIDDGPAEFEMGLEMARLAEADGTEVIVATPHQAGCAALLNSLVVQTVMPGLRAFRGRGRIPVLL